MCNPSSLFLLYWKVVGLLDKTHLPISTKSQRECLQEEPQDTAHKFFAISKENSPHTIQKFSMHLDKGLEISVSTRDIFFLGDFLQTKTHHLSENSQGRKKKFKSNQFVQSAIFFTSITFWHVSYLWVWCIYHKLPQNCHTIHPILLV